MRRRPQGAREGQSVVEYALLIAFVVIGSVAGISFLQGSTAAAYTKQQQALVAPTYVPSTYVAPTATTTATATPTAVPSGNSSGSGSNVTIGASGSGEATATAAAAVTATPTVVTSGTYRSSATLYNDTTTQGASYAVKMTATNTSSADGVTARIFINLKEYYTAGRSTNDITINADGSDYCSTSMSGWKTYNAASYIYYVEITFSGEIQGASGAYPWNDSCIARVRFSNYSLNLWNGSNDPSQSGLMRDTYTTSPQIPVYRNGTRVYGNEP